MDAHETPTQNEELLRKKADAYLVLGSVIHISYIDGTWKRGIVKEVKHDFFMLDERLDGLIPVFFLEIKSIEPYTPRRE
jgi:hypothetical protein